MTHPILSMLPDDARNLYFEQELAEEDSRLDADRNNSGVTKLIHLYQDLKEVMNSPALRATLRKR